MKPIGIGLTIIGGAMTLIAICFTGCTAAIIAFAGIPVCYFGTYLWFEYEFE